VLGNGHASCGAGEKLEITSNAYLLLTIVKRTKEQFATAAAPCFFKLKGRFA
jgi:hypothetical protein